MTELDAYRDALHRIVEVCAHPFGKDARAARRIAKSILAAFEDSHVDNNKTK